MSEKKKKEFTIDEGRGFLFKNSYKKKPTQPDYTGNANIGGETYKVSLWKKTTKKGDPMLSFSIQEKATTMDEDDLPF